MSTRVHMYNSNLNITYNNLYICIYSWTLYTSVMVMIPSTFTFFKLVLNGSPLTEVLYYENRPLLSLGPCHMRDKGTISRF